MDTTAPAAGPRVADERLIRLSAPAGVKVRSLAAREAQGGFLRVAISGGGCNGLSYKMRFVGEAKPADILVRSEGVEVLVDPKSALYLRGTHLDYSDKMIGGGFARVHGGGKSDALKEGSPMAGVSRPDRRSGSTEGRGNDLFESFQRQGQLGTPLVLCERVQFIDDDPAHRGELW